MASTKYILINTKFSTLLGDNSLIDLYYMQRNWNSMNSSKVTKSTHFATACKNVDHINSFK